MDIEFINSEINNFIEQYWGTAIGEHIYNWRCNTSDDDHDGIEAIYEELKNQGYT